MKKFWLLKTEGDVYPISQLKKDGRTPWSGVRNFTARNYMWRDMRKGDLCLFYHSSTADKGVFGIAKVVSAPYADPTQFDTKSEYFEKRAIKEKPVWQLVDIGFVKAFKNPVSLETLRADPKLQSMLLWRANRLSIQPVSEAEFQHIISLAAKSPSKSPAKNTRNAIVAA